MRNKILKFIIIRNRNLKKNLKKAKQLWILIKLHLLKTILMKNLSQ